MEVVQSQEDRFSRLDLRIFLNKWCVGNLLSTHCSTTCKDYVDNQSNAWTH